ncbi:MAG TPA: CYCXC family (seleno)protein [Longimicrobiales bacterium]|nr:CYCXC family (seleno)protein [Longimicrobiales bacterium]
MSAKQRPTRRGKSAQRSQVPLIGTVAGLFVIVVLLVFANARKAHAVHPDPRPDAAMIRTVSANHYHDEYVATSYRKASKVKQILDGLFCYCFCKGGGHYSLLDCFRDDHGAGCDICMGEAQLAHDMAEKGATLEQIRAEIDKDFGRAPH